MPSPARIFVEDWACAADFTPVDLENTACISLAVAFESEEYRAAYSDGTLHSDGTTYSDAGVEFLTGGD